VPPPGATPPGGAPPPPGATPPGGDGAAAPFPMSFSVDYPDRKLDRLSTALRIFWAIPILIIVEAFAGDWGYAFDTSYAPMFSGFIVLPTALMIIFREKYPRWWFDFNRELFRFFNRVVVYLLLMDDRYPSTDAQQSVHLELEYPDAPRDLNRLMPLIKWLLAIPHFILLFFISFGAIVAVIYAWFVILITGKYPPDVFEFLVGFLRWQNRVYSYAVLLTTDKYPPFKFAP
jgi:hypothetical protein